MKKILIISTNEICTNPRLIKSTDFFLNKKCHVTIINTIYGTRANITNEAFLNTRKVNYIENNINKLTLVSKIRWFYVSIVHSFFIILRRNLNPSFIFPFILNKGLINICIPKENFDIILINLVDNLPFASLIKKKQKNKPLLIYDSQEYFVGQYSCYDVLKYNWVVEAEKDIYNT